MPARAASCDRTYVGEAAPFGSYIPGTSQSLIRSGTAKLSSLKVGQSLRLAVWNLHKWEDANIAKDFAALGDKADIFLVQEAVITRDSNRTMAALTDRQWTIAVSFSNASTGPTGVATALSISPDKECFVRSEVREPVTGTPKATLLSWLPMEDGRKLLVVNFHGINFVTLNEYQSHLDQIFKIIRAHKGPLLVAGDFNTHVPGRFYILDNFMQKLKLKRIALGNDTRTLQLDHILARGIRFNWAWVVNWMNSSDHYPLVAEFTLE